MELFIKFRILQFLHDITEILLKVALNTINLTLFTGGVYGDNQLCATDKLYQIKKS
jgi:hypothetical protein